MEFLFGILSGVVTTLLFWLWRNHLSPPKIVFGNELSKVIYPNGESGYLFIYKNSGHRCLVDLAVRVVVKIPGIVTWDKNLTQSFRVPSSSDNKLLLKRNLSTTSRIKLEISAEILESRLISKAVKDAILERNNALEELLKLNEQAYVQVLLLGNDEGTGLRKVFESRKYNISDIKEGVFNRNELIVEESNNN